MDRDIDKVLSETEEKKVISTDEEKAEEEKEPFSVEYPENYKRIPLVVMLIAGLAVGIAAFVVHDELVSFLWTLVSVLVVFYIVGVRIRKLLEKFWYDNALKEYEEKNAAVSDEGEVVQKEFNGETESEE